MTGGPEGPLVQPEPPPRQIIPVTSVSGSSWRLEKPTIPERREKVRGHIAYALIALLITLALSGLGLIASKQMSVTEVVAVLAPVVGLIGTVLGFYYGGKPG